jgi:hypothetical protein
MGRLSSRAYHTGTYEHWYDTMNLEYDRMSMNIGKSPEARPCMILKIKKGEGDSYISYEAENMRYHS